MEQLNRLEDSFRAGWKYWTEHRDEKPCMNMFIKEMNNELWNPEETNDVELGFVEVN